MSSFWTNTEITALMSSSWPPANATTLHGLNFHIGIDVQSYAEPELWYYYFHPKVLFPRTMIYKKNIHFLSGGRQRCLDGGVCEILPFLISLFSYSFLFPPSCSPRPSVLPFATSSHSLHHPHAVSSTPLLHFNFPASLIGLCWACASCVQSVLDAVNCR